MHDVRITSCYFGDTEIKMTEVINKAGKTTLNAAQKPHGNFRATLKRYGYHIY